MDHDADLNGSSTAPPSFAFAFNDSNFSDRLLRIEIMSGPAEMKAGENFNSSIADWARHRKRRRADLKKDGGCEMVEFLEGHEEQVMIGTEPDADADADAEDVGLFDGIDEEPVAMIEESATAMVLSNVAAGELPGPGNCDWNIESAMRITTLHISSAILAAKSPFFFKLFSNGMRESEQRDVTLRISSGEEAAVMDMLQFMYSGRVRASTAPALLDVLMAADKFEVASCMRHCSRMLHNIPMTRESALLYLDLPSSVLLADAVQPLTDAAKNFLASRFKDITRFLDEVMNLPLAGVEAVLSSDDLQITSEDAVYDFVIKWAKVHYPKTEERREILGSKLVRLIRFPMMTGRKLKKVLTCADLDHELASKLVLEALFYKAEVPHRQRQLAMETTLHKRYSERAYKYRPVKVVEFDTPHQQCIIFLDLKREECVGLFSQGRVYSQAFHLGGQGFFLSAHCNMDQHSAFHCFGLFLGMQERGLVSLAVDYEFAARYRPTKEFTVKYKGTYKFTGGKAVGYRNLFNTSWPLFIADDSPYFIDNMLHLRAELTVKAE